VANFVLVYRVLVIESDLLLVVDMVFPQILVCNLVPSQVAMALVVLMEQLELAVEEVPEDILVALEVYMVVAAANQLFLMKVQRGPVLL
jgi:hypothetical protein